MLLIRMPQVRATTLKKTPVNLVQASLHMIKFLQEVEKHPSLYSNVHLLQEAVRRYEEVWLPLVAKHGPLHWHLQTESASLSLSLLRKLGLVPPLDVEHPGGRPPHFFWLRLKVDLALSHAVPALVPERGLSHCRGCSRP